MCRTCETDRSPCDGNHQYVPRTPGAREAYESYLKVLGELFDTKSLEEHYQAHAQPQEEWDGSVNYDHLTKDPPGGEG